MGDIDINVKNFLKINSVFAQLFEKGVYHGTGYNSHLCQFLSTYELLMCEL